MAKRISKTVDLEDIFKTQLIKHIYENHIELVTKWSTKYSLFLGKNSKKRLTEIVFNWFYTNSLLADFQSVIKLVNSISIDLTEKNDPNKVKTYIVLNFRNNDEIKKDLINRYIKTLNVAKNEIFQMEQAKNSKSSEEDKEELLTEETHSLI